jgi:hypothetical protein
VFEESFVTSTPRKVAHLAGDEASMSSTDSDVAGSPTSPAKRRHRLRRAPPRYSPSDYNVRVAMEEVRSELSQLAVLNPNTTVNNNKAKV